MTSNLSFIEPMKALPVRDLPTGDWLYEMKFDGYRALAFKSGKNVRLISRNQTDFGNDYPPAYRFPKAVDRQKLNYRRRDCRPRPAWEIFFPTPSILRNK